MNESIPSKEKLPFAEVKASSAFMAEAQLLLVREVMSRSGESVAPMNHLTFYHGRDWKYQREEHHGFTPQTGHLQLVQQKVTVSIDQILDNDMSVLPQLILGFGGQMATNMAEKMEGEMTAVAEEVGNTTAVSKDGSIIDACLEMLEKGHWSIDSKGRLCAPLILPDAQSRQRFESELETRREEFEKRFEEIRARKELPAREAEQERLNKFDADE